MGEEESAEAADVVTGERAVDSLDDVVDDNDVVVAHDGDMLGALAIMPEEEEAWATPNNMPVYRICGSALCFCLP